MYKFGTYFIKTLERKTNSRIFKPIDTNFVLAGQL